MSKLLTIAEAVKDHLNIQSGLNTFTPYTFTAVRTYIPWSKLKDLVNLTVMVVPGGLSYEQLTRASQEGELLVDVGVGKKIDITANTEADALLGLVEDIEESLRAIEADGYSWVKNEIKAIYDEQILLVNHVYLSVIRMTFHAAS